MPIRCRQIVDSDIPAVAELLLHGLPGRSRDFWLCGLRRMSSTTLPLGIPRYGFVLDNDGELVGVTVMIHSVVDGHIRCHLSSWYVAPPFRAMAALMVRTALKRRDVTYVNISPNPKTWSIIEAQDFKAYALGQSLSIPAFGRPRRCLVRAAGTGDEPVLTDHAALNCISLVVEADGGSHPFVFLAEKRKLGYVRLKTAQLIYCRDIASFVRFAGPIGRYLLRSNIMVVVHDANGPERGLVGHFSTSSGPRYFRGPNPPRLGDLAYSEWVVFGPGLRGDGRFSPRAALRHVIGKTPARPLLER